MGRKQHREVVAGQIDHFDWRAGEGGPTPCGISAESGYFSGGSIILRAGLRGTEESNRHRKWLCFRLVNRAKVALIDAEIRAQPSRISTGEPVALPGYAVQDQCEPFLFVEICEVLLREVQVRIQEGADLVDDSEEPIDLRPGLPIGVADCRRRCGIEHREPLDGVPRAFN